MDKDKGGYFAITPRKGLNLTTKQQYLPSSNVLQTRYMHEDGVLNLTDFFPRPNGKSLSPQVDPGMTPGKATIDSRKVLKRWLVRRVECTRGEIDVDVEVFPAFNYARDEHTTEILGHKHSLEVGETRQKVIFKSKSLTLELSATIDCGDSTDCPLLSFHKKNAYSGLGMGVTAQFHLREGQAVSFILRDYLPDDTNEPEHMTTALIDQIQQDTQSFWFNWISKSRYKGRWREIVARSLMILKLLTYEPTGAIIAAPTFSLPEDIGGVRNWDYRFSWVRDASFTIYIFLRMGFSEEAEAYMHFISDRFKYSRQPNGALPIMFSKSETHSSQSTTAGNCEAVPTPQQSNAIWSCVGKPRLFTLTLQLYCCSTIFHFRVTYDVLKQLTSPPQEH